MPLTAATLVRRLRRASPSLLGNLGKFSLEFIFALLRSHWLNEREIEESVENVEQPFSFVRFNIHNLSGMLIFRWMSRKVSDQSNCVDRIRNV